MGKTEKVHIVFDCETLSTEKNAAIASIGYAVVIEMIGFYPFISVADAINIDVEDYDGYSDESFNISASTFMWWLKQSDEARSSIYDSEVVSTYSAALRVSELVDHYKSKFPDAEVLVYGFGAVADIVWIENLFDRTCSSVPWSYRDVRCLRTILARAGVDFRKHLEDGKAHNAMYDAIAEAKALIEVMGIEKRMSSNDKIVESSADEDDDKPHKGPAGFTTVDGETFRFESYLEMTKFLEELKNLTSSQAS